MAWPIIILAAAAAAKAAADMYSNTRNQRAGDRQAASAKRDARRAAIERAMGGTALSKPNTIHSPPDLTVPGAIGGIANVAGTVAGGYAGKSP